MGNRGLAKLGRRLIGERVLRTLVLATGNLILNLIYGFYNGILGLQGDSPYFLFSGVYHFLLGFMGFLAVTLHLKARARQQRWAVRAIGFLLMGLSLVLWDLVFLGARGDGATGFGEIPMIAIATYTFTKVAVVLVGVAKGSKRSAPLLVALQTIRYSQVAVSVLTLQRSMLVSFGNMEPEKIRLFHILTGSAVCILVFGLGLWTELGQGKEKTYENIKNHQDR